MNITLRKNKEALKEDITTKSMDLENFEDFKPEFEKCIIEREYITISPECVRCNLCVAECPVGAIAKAKANKPARILDNCVKCGICAQTCPIKCIHVIESTSKVDDDVNYRLQELKVPHRTLKMKSIQLDEAKCKSCGTCVKFCPTKAITLEENEKVTIDQEACIGCGACVNVCDEDAIKLVRDLGSVIKTKKLLVDQESCVACHECEENCPVHAIKKEDDETILSEGKCILCEVCSNKCPVGALKLERLSNES